MGLAILGGGVGITVFSMKFQNHKHGFPQAEEDEDDE